MKRVCRAAPVWGVGLAVAGILLFGVLGLWQLDRAAQKRRLLDEFARGDTAAVHDGLVADAAAARYQPLRLRGRYDPAHQILLDSMVSGSRVGYHVLTPFDTDAGTVLVNRGWLPADGDRTRLPDVTVDDRAREITGRIAFLPRPGLRLAPAPVEPGMPWPRRLLFPDIAEASAHLGRPLAGYQVLLDPALPDGHERQWQPTALGPQTHLAYAVQWFGLALAVPVLAYTTMRRRDARR